jgi:ATP-dependent protease ClpP protease subunit
LENKIFFYDDITNESVLELNRSLQEVDTKLQNTKNVLGDSFDPVIHLHLKTDGGELSSAIAVIDFIPTLKSKVYTYVDGYVASAGTLISIVGHKRFMGRHASLLIHQLSSEIYGKYSELEDSMENCNNMMKFIKGFYKQYTKIPMERLDELLKRDLCLSIEECLEYGIVDQQL